MGFDCNSSEIPSPDYGKSDRYRSSRKNDINNGFKKISNTNNFIFANLSANIENCKYYDIKSITDYPNLQMISAIKNNDNTNITNLNLLLIFVKIIILKQNIVSFALNSYILFLIVLNCISEFANLTFLNWLNSTYLNICCKYH